MVLHSLEPLIVFISTEFSFSDNLDVDQSLVTDRFVGGGFISLYYLFFDAQFFG
jgi:hypothetical protein